MSRRGVETLLIAQALANPPPVETEAPRMVRTFDIETDPHRYLGDAMAAIEARVGRIGIESAHMSRIPHVEYMAEMTKRMELRAVAIPPWYPGVVGPLMVIDPKPERTMAEGTLGQPTPKTAEERWVDQIRSLRGLPEVPEKPRAVWGSLDRATFLNRLAGDPPYGGGPWLPPGAIRKLLIR